MYSAMGSTVKYKGKQCPVKGFAPAAKVNCGLGYALLIIVDGQSKYVNTSELECKNEDKIRGFTILQNHHDIRLFSDAHKLIDDTRNKGKIFIIDVGPASKLCNPHQELAALIKQNNKDK